MQGWAIGKLVEDDGKLMRSGHLFSRSISEIKAGRWCVSGIFCQCTDTRLSPKMKPDASMFFEAYHGLPWQVESGVPDRIPCLTETHNFPRTSHPRSVEM